MMGKIYPWWYRLLISCILLLTMLPTVSYAQSTTARFDPPVSDFTTQVDSEQSSSLQSRSLQTPLLPSSPLQLTSTTDSLSITWPNATVSAAAAIAQLPTKRYQGYELPLQLFTVALPAAATTMVAGSGDSLVLNSLTSEPWRGEIQPAAPLQPAVIDGETAVDLPLAPETVALPTAPLFLLRQGTLHGQMVAIYALSPIYQEGDQVKMATALSATINHALLWAETPTDVTSAALQSPSRTSPVALQPTNPDAAQQAIKFQVSAIGIQTVTGAQLAAAGFSLATINPALLQLHYNGAEIALEIEGVSNGRLTADSIVRFYVPTIGDRWNTTSIYWLTIGNSAGVRMASRSVAPAAAPMRNSALAQGVWESPKIYDSRSAGADQDYWFHQKLILSQNNNAALETVAVDVTPHLPRIDGTTTYTIAGTTNLRGQHTVRVLINSTPTDLTWNSMAGGTFAPNWQPSFTSTVNSNTLGIGLLSVVAANAQSDPTVWLDKVFWEEPVQLALQQTGAHFTGVAGTWRYTWSGLPANYRFYDVTNAANPVLLIGSTVDAFEDGPTPHQYLVAGPGTLQTPAVLPHAPVHFGTTGANAIYIAPAGFMDALEPLLQLRREQGYTVASIDVQDIYDGWSYGHLSATAIRTFLRYAHASWSPTPISVVLVGDGTWDPHNYEEKDNTNFIPPYLADVDPWLGEAACENCYVQLDGDDPLTGDDPAGQFFSIDMWIGRLPVKSPGELTDVAKKMISYEKMSGVHLWQNRVVFIADNYIRSITDTGEKVVDLAGDFAKHSDNIAMLSPATIDNERVYYDPYPQVADPTGQQPWRISNATQAFKNVLSELSAGAGVVVYNGHSHQWQWAVTDESAAANPDYLFGLYDADGLTNKDSYFINLSMTCLTSQFQKPAVSGTVLDERLLLNPTGGAVAVWGPAGLSVAYGHDFLQRGFFEKLWSAPANTLHLGELIETGYTKLLTEDTCCQDTAKTFLLLGDPLTKAQASRDKIYGLYVPTVRR